MYLLRSVLGSLEASLNIIVSGGFSAFPASAPKGLFLGSSLAFLLHWSLYRLSLQFLGPLDEVLKKGQDGLKFIVPTLSSEML